MFLNNGFLCSWLLKTKTVNYVQQVVSNLDIFSITLVTMVSYFFLLRKMTYEYTILGQHLYGHRSSPQFLTVIICYTAKLILHKIVCPKGFTTNMYVYIYKCSFTKSFMILKRISITNTVCKARRRGKKRRKLLVVVLIK